MPMDGTVVETAKSCAWCGRRIAWRVGPQWSGWIAPDARNTGDVNVCWTGHDRVARGHEPLDGTRGA